MSGVSFVVDKANVIGESALGTGGPTSLFANVILVLGGRSICAVPSCQAEKASIPVRSSGGKYFRARVSPATVDTLTLAGELPHAL